MHETWAQQKRGRKLKFGTDPHLSLQGPLGRRTRSSALNQIQTASSEAPSCASSVFAHGVMIL